jgi:hypothetical protein
MKAILVRFIAVEASRNVSGDKLKSSLKRRVKMRKWCLILLTLLAIGICTAQVPNLVGNWNGSENGYFASNGSYKLAENLNVNLAIVEQKDRLFAGNLTYPLENGTRNTEDFSGAIGLDNRTLYFAEFKEGYNLGTIISDNEIELIYLQDGEMGGTYIEKLHRKH